MEDREYYTNLIVDSTKPKKLVVAGAGTGKSFTFKKVLSKSPQNNLVLTFINNLVDDLKNDLGQYAEVKTFHSFCRKLLHKHAGEGIDSEFEYYPDLLNIIIEDATILKNGIEKEAIEKSFKTFYEDNNVEFYLDRANYYNAVGYDDSVYRVIKILRNASSLVPHYNTIVIDEYQDFNALEAELLEVLSTNCSYILIAGDDDQSVYSFKYANPIHIRKKYEDTNFSNFELPYCSRCCAVIVNSVKDILENAQKFSLLPNRIVKEYICHEESKQIDNETYPLIQKVKISVNTKKSPYIAKYILSVLQNLDRDEVNQANQGDYPLALVIGPTHYLNQIEEALNNLSKEYRINLTKKLKPSAIISALAHLYKNNKSNLGWRIILQEKGDGKLLNDIISQITNDKSAIVDHLPTDFKALWLDILDKIRKEYEEENYTSKSSELIEKLGENYMEAFRNKLKHDELTDEEDAPIEQQEPANSTLSEIKLTTYSGSKGLSGGQVFIVGLDEGEFPRQEPTFDDVCQYIVALTRTRKQCHLLTVGRFGAAQKNASQFLNWINKDNMNVVTINKDSFN
ncbi:TPA: UvrD-helicase domain-containing protein [Legionella pneumophila]